MAKRKKKVEKKTIFMLPDRLFANWVIDRYIGGDVGERIPVHRLSCSQHLDDFTGGVSPVGEYVLIRTGTTRTLLEDERDQG
jgi:hypothetical protein